MRTLKWLISAEGLGLNRGGFIVFEKTLGNNPGLKSEVTEKSHLNLTKNVKPSPLLSENKRVDASSVARKLCLKKDRVILTLLAVHFELDQKNPGWKWSCFSTFWETLALIITMNLFVVDVRMVSQSLSGLQYLHFKTPICFMICVSWPFVETGSPFPFEKYCEFDSKTNMKELDINIPNKPNKSTTNGSFWPLMNGYIMTI